MTFKKPTRKEGTHSFRFWRMVEKTETCWIWRGCINWCGYGKFSISSREHMLAHRFAYEELVEKIPEGLTIDHLCRNRKCVNPEHMEPVVQEVNYQRGRAARGFATTGLSVLRRGDIPGQAKLL